MISRTPEENLVSAREALDRARRPLITTHVNPDGDGLGSELALHRFLWERGKQTVILNASPTPPFYEFLDSSEPLPWPFVRPACQVSISALCPQAAPSGAS